MSGFKSKKSRPGFTRPSIDLDRTGIVREWRSVKVQDLEEDDIVAGMGRLLMGVLPTCDGQMAINAGDPDDKFYFMNEDEEVLAFVKKEN